MFFYYSLDYKVDMHHAYIYIWVLQRKFPVPLLHPYSTVMVSGGLSLWTRYWQWDASLSWMRLCDAFFLFLSSLRMSIHPLVNPTNSKPSGMISKSIYEIVKAHAEQH